MTLGSPQHSDAPSSRSEFAPAVYLVALIVIAVVLRACRLADWTFEGDEIYTLRDSLHPRAGNPRPLLFLLNHYLVRPLVPLDELGLRLLPALCGILAVPAFYFITRPLAGARAALFGALLLAVNPMHVYQSQYARYWSLVFMLCTIYPYALYLGVRSYSGRWLALGLVTAVLAVLAHPVAVLLVGGLGLLGLLHLRRDVVARLWSRPTVRWIVALVAVLAVVAAWRSVDMLYGWIVAHDVKTRIPDHLRDAVRGPGLKQLAIMMAYTEGLTLPVTLVGATGIYLLWRAGDRSLALLLFCLFIVPVVTILLLSSRTPVSVTYLLPTAPVIFIGAGVLLERLSRVDIGLRPRWLLPATLTTVIIAAGLPTLISQYRDGRRYNFRGAAQWLESQLTPGDIVFSVQSRVMAHYLPDSVAPQPLAPDTVSIAHAARMTSQAGQDHVLWIVLPAPSHAFRSNLKRGGLIGWLYENCQLRHSLGVGRIDFRQQYLHIYRCPPADPVTAARHTRSSTPPRELSGDPLAPVSLGDPARFERSEDSR